MQGRLSVDICYAIAPSGEALASPVQPAPLATAGSRLVGWLQGLWRWEKARVLKALGRTSSACHRCVIFSVFKVLLHYCLTLTAPLWGAGAGQVRMGCCFWQGSEGAERFYLHTAASPAGPGLQLCLKSEQNIFS